MSEVMKKMQKYIKDKDKKSKVKKKNSTSKTKNVLLSLGSALGAGTVAAAAAVTAQKALKKTKKRKMGLKKKTTKPVVWRNSKRVGRTRVASKLRSEYNPKTDQWIKYTD